MKIPAFLLGHFDEITSYGELRDYVRGVRYRSARRWAARRSRTELEHTIALLMAYRLPWGGKDSQREQVARRQSHEFGHQLKRKYEAELCESLERHKHILDLEAAAVLSLKSKEIVEVHKRNGSLGGSVAAAVTRKVREHAQRLAKEREPVGGWRSAPEAREAIMADVREFARPRGRNFSERKVEEWLRDAGIKRADLRSSS